MRKRFCSLTILLGFALVGFLSAQEATPSRVAAVTVYTDRALVTRTAEANLVKGETLLLFTGLPSAADPASVQVSGRGAFTLRDVRVYTRQTVRDVSVQLTALQNERRGYEDKLAVLTDRVQEAEQERLFLAEMVKRLTSHAGDSETLPLDTAAWAKMLDFHRTRNVAVDDTLRAARDEQKALKAEMDRVDREIRTLGAGSRLSVTDVELTLDAPAAVKAGIDISYLVVGPSWTPDYVLRANSEASRISVLYRARVRQNTGEDWDDANLSLSTARPQAGGSAPELDPWYLDVYRPVLSKREAPMSLSRSKSASAADFEINEESGAVMSAPAMELETAQAATGATAVTFSVPGATTVVSDNKDRTVIIAALDLPVRYSYAAVPKLSRFAYFRSDVENDSEFPFLAGDSHVYVDGSYVADAAVPAVSAGGSFRADLGVDESITVERKLIRKFDETTGGFSKKSRTTWEYEIRIKNGKRKDIEIAVSDQIPVSLNEQIVVKPLAPAYSKDTDALKKTDVGFYLWSLNLAPGKETILPLSFSVEYPKGTFLSGLE